MADELPVPGGTQPLGKAMEGILAWGRGRIQRTPESHEQWGGAGSPGDSNFSPTFPEEMVKARLRPDPIQRNPWLPHTGCFFSRPAALISGRFRSLDLPPGRKQANM